MIGVTCTEEIIAVPSLPSLDSHCEIEICGRWQSTGGNGLNVAVHAARLGADVALISKIPRNIWPDVTAALKRSGVDASLVVPEYVHPAPEVLLVTDDLGDYSVFVSDRSGLAFTPEDIAQVTGLAARYVHIDGFTLGALNLELQVGSAQYLLELASSSGAALAKGNEKLELVVPESRTCDGGLPILRQGMELARRLWLIPDVTLAFAMPRCDAVLVGVETFFSDGSFTNTVGSLTIAVVANHFAVPFYAVTDLTKADLAGSKDIQPQRTFSQPLTGRSELTDEDRIETSYPPLEAVPARLLTAYITEKGIVDPARIRSVALSEYAGESK